MHGHWFQRLRVFESAHSLHPTPGLTVACDSLRAALCHFGFTSMSKHCSGAATDLILMLPMYVYAQTRDQRRQPCCWRGGRYTSNETRTG
jgi:hypothetical protein